MKVLITRPRAQANDLAEQLREAGYEPIYLPVIEIRPVENNTALAEALRNLQQYTWVIFTSVNAVYAVMNHEVISQKPGLSQSTFHCTPPRIAAVGPKTAQVLRQHGVEPTFIPAQYHSQAILSGLGNIHGQWILLPRGNLARADLPKALLNAGALVHEVIVYYTRSIHLTSQELAVLKSGVDVITFASPSAVESFIATVSQHKLNPLHLPNNPKIACIGPVTAQTARENGFTHVVVAEESTAEGLVKAIQTNHLEQE